MSPLRKTLHPVFLTLMVVLSQAVITKAQQVPGVGNGAVTFASVYCRIIAPIGITKINDMYFGTIVSGKEGSVVLNPAEGRSTSDNVDLDPSHGRTSAASFEVTDGAGSGNASRHEFTSFSVSLPTSDILLVNQDGKTMRVSNFTSNVSGNGDGSFTNGKGMLSVGATLFVNASQGTGKYQSSVEFPVTVNFH